MNLLGSWSRAPAECGREQVFLRDPDSRPDDAALTASPGRVLPLCKRVGHRPAIAFRCAALPSGISRLTDEYPKLVRCGGVRYAGRSA